MELDCKVAQELYVLYEEKLLSAQVREAVDGHLETCEKCKNIYKTGHEFEDVNIKFDPKQAPEKINESLITKLKIRRLKFVILAITVFIIVVFSSYGYNVYRYNTIQGQRYQGELKLLKFELEGFEGILFQMIESENFNNEDLIRYSERAYLYQERYMAGVANHYNSHYYYLAGKYMNDAINEKDNKTKIKKIEKALMLVRHLQEDVDFIFNHLEGKSLYQWNKQLNENNNSALEQELIERANGRGIF